MEFANQFQTSVGNYTTEITLANQMPDSQTNRNLTTYDYLSLLPVVITALTPLILGLAKKSNSKTKD